MLVSDLVRRYARSLDKPSKLVNAMIPATAHLRRVEYMKPKDWKDLQIFWSKGGWLHGGSIGVTPAHIAHCKPEVRRNYFAARRRPAKPWGVSTLGKAFVKMREIVRWGVSENLLDIRCYDIISASGYKVPGATPPRRVTTVAWEDVQSLQPHCPELMWDVIQVLWHTGMRGKELATMHSREIERHADRWEYRPREHKTAWRGKEKLIVIGPKAIAILEKYWTNGPLFPDMNLDVLSFNRRAIIRKHGLPYWSLHQLRHSRATIVRRELGLEASAAALGNTITAAQIYAERNEQLARLAARSG